MYNWNEMKFLLWKIISLVSVTLVFSDIEVTPQSTINYGYGLMYDYSGQVLHGLNRYNLIVGLDIPDLRHPEGIDLIGNVHKGDMCEVFRGTPHTVTLRTCEKAWLAYLGFIERMKESQAKLDHIYEKQLPAIIPGFKTEDLR